MNCVILIEKIIETPPIWFIALTLILGAACLGVSHYL